MYIYIDLFFFFYIYIVILMVDGTGSFIILELCFWMTLFMVGLW